MKLKTNSVVLRNCLETVLKSFLKIKEILISNERKFLKKEPGVKERRSCG